MDLQASQGANIFDFAKYHGAMTGSAADMQPCQPLLNEVEAYWDALRNGRDVPARGDVDPRGLERAIHNAFIVERQPGTLARVRLSGEALNRMMGMDLRSMPLHAMFDPEERAKLDTMIEQVFDGPQCLRLTLRGTQTHPLVGGAMLLLPLRDDFGQITRALGVLEVSGEMTPPPCRLIVEGHQPRPLTRREGQQYPTADRSTQTQGMEEIYEQFVQRKGPNAKRPALRVIKADD